MSFKNTFLNRWWMKRWMPANDGNVVEMILMIAINPTLWFFWPALVSSNSALFFSVPVLLSVVLEKKKKMSTTVKRMMMMIIFKDESVFLFRNSLVISKDTETIFHIFRAITTPIIIPPQKKQQQQNPPKHASTEKLFVFLKKKIILWSDYLSRSSTSTSLFHPTSLPIYKIFWIELLIRGFFFETWLLVFDCFLTRFLSFYFLNPQTLSLYLSLSLNFLDNLLRLNFSSTNHSTRSIPLFISHKIKKKIKTTTTWVLWSLRPSYVLEWKVLSINFVHRNQPLVYPPSSNLKSVEFDFYSSFFFLSCFSLQILICFDFFRSSWSSQQISSMRVPPVPLPVLTLPASLSRRLVESTIFDNFLRHSILPPKVP